jgi:hypothetical protein
MRVWGRWITAVVLSSFVVLAAPVPAAAQEEVRVTSAHEKTLVFGFGYDFMPGVELINVPAVLRTVPTHPSDGAQRMRTIPGDSVSTPPWHMLTMSLGLQVRIASKLRARVGALLGAAQQSNEGPSEWDGIQEWGQFVNSAARGTGTSLVFYGLTRSRLVPGGYAELQLGSATSGLLLGYEASSIGVTLRQGWDRYDRLETYKEIESRQTFYHPYAGFAFGIAGNAQFRFKAGPVTGQRSFDGVPVTSSGKAYRLTASVITGF